MKIGVIADTHGLVRPEVLRVFAGVGHIVHAGDVGGAHVLAALRELAPVTFVGGNNDDGSDGTDVVRVRLDGLRILLRRRCGARGRTSSSSATATCRTTR